MTAGRRALVTGGASGFGLAIARQLVADGARVVLVDIAEPTLEAAVVELGEAASVHVCDVRRQAAVREAVAAAAWRMGGLDTLVVSAGVIEVRPLGEVTEEGWDRTLDINLKGAFLVIQAAAPHLVASGRGRIVAISSDAAGEASPASPPTARPSSGSSGWSSRWRWSWRRPVSPRTCCARSAHPARAWASRCSPGRSARPAAASRRSWPPLLRPTPWAATRPRRTWWPPPGSSSATRLRS